MFEFVLNSNYMVFRIHIIHSFQYQFASILCIQNQMHAVVSKIMSYRIDCIAKIKLVPWAKHYMPEKLISFLIRQDFELIMAGCHDKCVCNNPHGQLISQTKCCSCDVIKYNRNLSTAIGTSPTGYMS